MGTGTSAYCLQIVHCFSLEALHRTRGAIASLFLAGLLLAAPAVAQVWEFNTEGDRQGWSARNNVGSLLAARGALAGDITGDDPQIQGPTSPTFSASGRRWLHVRMRVTSGNYAELFWSTLLNWSFSQSRSVRFNVLPDGVWRDYVVDMSTNSNWTGTIRQLRFDPSEASSGRFEIDFLRLTGARPFIGWEFDRPGDMEGWSAANGLITPAVSGGCLRAVVSGPDPYFTGPSSPEIDAAVYRWLHVRMKAPAGTEAEFFWGTPSEPWHSPGGRVGFPVIPDGEFHEYVVDLSGHPAWTGTVIMPRLDPSVSGSSGVAEIDFIRLTSQLPPPRVHTGPALPGRFAFVGEEVSVTATIFASGYTAASGLRATLSLSDQTLLSPATQPVPAPADGSDLRTVSWTVRATSQALTQMTVTVEADMPSVVDRTVTEAVFSAPPPAPEDTPGEEAVAFVDDDGSAVLQNNRLRLVFIRSSFGFGVAQLFARDGASWKLAGGVAPLSRLIYRRPSGVPAELAIVPSSVSVQTQSGSANLTLFFTRSDPDGGLWNGSLKWYLGQGEYRARAEFTLSCNTARELLSWTGPSLAAGNRSFGSSKVEALFPGIEWLTGSERSSNSLEHDPPLDLRVVPHPYRVTVPLMAVSSGEGVTAVLWDPLGTWDGANRYPNAKFSSPNWLEGQANHLMELFVPSIKGGWVPENGLQAGIPYSLQPGFTLLQEAWILARPGAGVLDAVDEWFRIYGVPPVPGGPDLLEQGLATARVGLMETVWDAATNQWKHVVEWGPGPAPEFAAALFADSLTEPNPATRSALRARVSTAVSQHIASYGPAVLGSSAACHIPEYRLPFFIGYLDEVMEHYQSDVTGLIQSQQPDGGWFVPANPDMPRLVTPGTKELGSCANNARILLNHARLTGSALSRLAGLKALAHMDTYTIPRAAQTWEVPQHAPDILAAAWAVAAYLDGYILTGDARYLEKARYWARAGLHFVYTWRAADRGIMDYATIPVLGSTHFVWSWLGLPVQWCGMVYAYYVERLADFDRTFPWRQICEGITRSCIQQMNVSPYPGTYGDSINLIASNTPNGVYINPDNIYKCALKLTGRYGEVNRQVVTGGGRTAYVSSAARLLTAALATNGSQMHVRVGYPAGETCFVMVYGLPLPVQVRKGTAMLTRVSDTDAAVEGWSYDIATTRLIIRARMTAPQETLSVVLSGTFAPLQTASIGQARSLPDGTMVSLRGVVSSGAAAGSSSLYIQAEDRSAGIRVSLASPALAEVPVGARVEVTGTLGTVSWEKALLSAGLRVESYGASPEPLGVSNRTCAGPGLSNAGLLVRTWGRVTARGTGFFYVDDGSGLLDGSSTGGIPNRGIRVAGDAGAVAGGQMVQVTGISSVFLTSGELRPLIRTRSAQDIAVMR
ncbi:MAG: hypothetical protein ACUVSM_03055 [Armatimonadota bacterium]